ncbi:hypothetical protein H6F90_11825 [Trichocoleus sp. FACHB-591]|uniref:hypothetical protein n=1 Tax=Trichocoleus sp. FACHB-591 TaxID=2692872 RepID=UPI00168484A8|nr:hypothetical protein [Trichocoleus sp. FACHB-591]MBD2095837.1 hypothetical protein [Trichocoleus sp. FACHB-591]
MSKQLRITVSDEEFAILAPIAERWNRPTSEIAVEFFRIGFVPGVERYRVMAEAADKWQATTCDRPRYRSMAHAITCNWDQLQSTKLNPKRLAAIRDGSQKPTETELLRLALALGISEQELELLPLLDEETTNAAR